MIIHLVISGSPIVQRIKKKYLCTRAIYPIQYIKKIENDGERYATDKMQDVRRTCE